MTMTSPSHILLCTSPIISQFGLTARNTPTPFLLPELVQTLDTLVYWWPFIKVDGARCLDVFRNNGGFLFHYKFMSTGTSYVEAVAHFISHDVNYCALLENPNIHRAL